MREKHPYGEFFPKHPHAIIIGSFPIGKFTNPKRAHEIKAHEINFFFGGERNLLWKLLGLVFNRSLDSKDKIKKLLEDKGIAVGDVIKSCIRKDGGASDSDLLDIEWNVDLLKQIHFHNIRKVFFTSKKVEAWFKKLFGNTPELDTITLISPSGQSIRSIHHHKDYASWREKNLEVPVEEFILGDYRRKFETIG